MKKIPVNVISGFLGSGKTTAIIQLLNQKTDDEQWAIVINEFGKISIDSQTVRTTSHSGTVYDISGGCICCSAKGYLYENLTGIVKSGDFSRIIIEPSGLGGIDAVSEIIGYIQELCLMPIICMVDITALENHRLQLNPIYRAQISMAEVIVFSKCDLVGEATELERLFAKFHTLFPNKLNCLTGGTNLLASLLNPDFGDRQEINRYRMLSLANPGLTDGNYRENILEFGTEITLCTEKLSQLFLNYQSIIRVKGFIRTKTGWNLFNYAITGSSSEACKEKKSNQLVIIMLNNKSTIMEEIKKQIEKCIG